MIRILHNALESGKSCLFDTEKQCYYELPEVQNKIGLNKSWFDYFETVREFLESDKAMAIILFYCTARAVKGKRYQVTLITQSESLDFWNIEKTGSGWLKHESDIRDQSAPKTGIEICQPGCAYMFYLVKEPDALNGVRVKSVMKLEGK